MYRSLPSFAISHRIVRTEAPPYALGLTTLTAASNLPHVATQGAGGADDASCPKT